MSRFGNHAIAASAGTGKTWALAQRYLALMAAGVAPDRICALTFSRKAAGEIFDTIVARLCAAATPEAERVVLLRKLLERSNRLRIGTLDSFILGVVRAFPLELGVPPDTRPIDNAGGEATAQRRALLARLCDPSQRGRDDDGSGAALLEAFRQATFGQEVKSLASRLDAIISDRFAFYLQHARKAWGQAGRIWTPSERWWESFEASARATAADPAYLAALRQAFGEGANAAKLGEACARIAEAGSRHAPDLPWPATFSKTVLAGLFDAVREPAPPELAYARKTYPLPSNLWPPLRAALGNLVAVEIERCLRQTAGLHALLERYDARHREAQRLEGGLTFTDLSRLLADPSHQPSSRATAADKLYVDYRLDGRLDHWLLDEFQDTSDDQWNAIANLIAEVVQDEQRSFFYVGDTKQSIYGWRSGNWRLFENVRRACLIDRTETMSDCHRSRPAIVETVNRVFANLAAAASWPVDKGPHPGAVAAFVGPSWPTHRAARHDQGAGFAALLEYAPKRGDSRDATEAEVPDDEAGADDPAQFEAAARILAAVEPCRRGLSAAVLVRGNTQGRACADALRRRLPGVAVVHEGTGGIVDNPVVTLFLALMRLAAHPADTLARRHVQMSPLADFVTAHDAHAAVLPGLEETAAPPADPRAPSLSARLLADVHAHGFAGALRAWSAHLAAAGALKDDDAFGHQRLRELLAAAEAFDATGSRDADAFDEHVRAFQVKSEAASGAVRVMTIHQSKGLGFDVVLVPFDPQARSFTNLGGTRMLRSDCGAAQPSDDGWVLQRPTAVALQAAGGAPVAALDAARAEANFEQLCVLYVALTRAKQALYLLVPAASKYSATVREADLLRAQLAGQAGDAAPEERASAPAAGSESAPPVTLEGLSVLYRAGDPGWLERTPPHPAARAADTPAAPAPLAVGFVPDVRRREPSKEHAEGKPMPARWLFSAEAGDVPAFGSALHRLFARIAWIEDADIEAIVNAWRAESQEPPTVLRDVEAQFRTCLGNAAVRGCLARPAQAPQADVWCEAPFSFVRERNGVPEIVSGRFDRLAIERDAAGRPLRATVMDYKSNRVATEGELAAKAEAYAPQMCDYMAAARRLLGLRADRVAAMILFTRVGRILPVSETDGGFHQASL